MKLNSPDFSVFPLTFPHAFIRRRFPRMKLLPTFKTERYRKAHKTGSGTVWL